MAATKTWKWDDWAEQSAQQCKQIILFGELADLLESKLTTVNCEQYTRVANMEEAIEAAAKTAVSGDIVLLSPGGTSFDAFNDFAERGVMFRELVNQL